MQVTCFGKNVLWLYRHLIMKMGEEAAGHVRLGEPAFSLRKIELSDARKELASIGTKTSIVGLSRLARNNPGLCEGFVADVGGTGVGTLWVMYRGGNHVEYKIRHIDAFIFDVFVNPAQRGHGYAGMMLGALMDYLVSQKGIHEAFLAVSLENKSAIRAYEKAGLRTIAVKSFLRVLKINIPYRKL